MLRNHRLPRLTRLFTARTWLLLACVLLCLSAYLFRPPLLPTPPLTPQVGYATLALLVGGVLFGRALALSAAAHPRPLALHPPQPARYTRRHGWAVAAGIVLMAVTAEASANQLGISALRRMSSHVQFFVLCGGVGLLVIGSSGLYAARSAEANTTASGPRIRRFLARRWEALCISAIVLAALALRVWRLETSITVLIDELHFVSGVLRLWASPDTDLLSPMTNLSPFTWLYPYWQTWTTALFGRDLEGLRMVSAVLGTLSVIGVWALGRSLFDRRTALVAALLLATLPPALHYGRVGIIQAGDATFGLLALAALAHGWRSGQRFAFAAAGAMLGLSQYFYEAGRLMFPALMLLWMGWVWWCARRHKAAQTRFSWGSVVVLLMVAAVVAAPVYYNLRVDDEALTMRLNSSGLGGAYFRDLLASGDPYKLNQFIEHAANPFLFYVNRTERFLMYGGQQPLILTVLVPLFLGGLAWCVWRLTRRDLGAALPLLWILLTSAGNALLTESYVSARFVVVFPALALVMALGLRSMSAVLARPAWLNAGRNRWRMGMMLLAPLAIGAYQAHYYFNIHLPYFNEQYRDSRLYRDVEDAMFRAAHLPPGAQATIMMEYNFDPVYNRDFLKLLTDDVTVRTFVPQSFDPVDFLDISREVDQAFFVIANDEYTLNLLLEHFGYLPDVYFSPNPDVPRRAQYAMFVYPAQEAPAQPVLPPVPADRRYRADLQWALAFVLVMTAGSAAYWQRTPLKAVGRWAFAPLPVIGRRVWALYTTPRAGRLARWLVLPLLLLAALALRPGNVAGAWLGVAAVIGAGAAWWRGASSGIDSQADSAMLPAFARPRPHMTLLRGYALMAGVIALALLALVNVLNALDAAEALAWLLHVPTQTQLALLLGGAALVGFGLAREQPTTPPAGAAWLLAVLLIGGLAFALRVVDLEYALHRFVDEIHSAAAVADLRAAPNRPLLTPHGTVTAFTWVYPQMQAWAYDLYGPTLTALRVVSAIFGTLTVLATAWVGRVLFGSSVGLLAALALATFPPHMHFSRIGLNNAADPLFGVLALGLLVGGLRDHRPGWLAWSGVMLGLTQYFYEGGRLLYPAVAAGVIVWWWFGRRRSDSPAHPVPVWRFFAAFLIVAAPVYYTLWGRDLPVWPRWGAMAENHSGWSAMFMRGPLHAPGLILAALLEPLHHVVQRPDQSWFYGGDTGLILWPLLLVFLPGGFVCLATLRRGARPSLAAALLIIWIGLALAGNALLHDRAFAARYVVIHPALMLVLALGIRALTDTAALPLGETARRRLLPVIALLVVLVQAGYYFAVHLPQHRDQFYVSLLLDDVLFRAGTLPDGTQAHVITPLVVREYSIAAYMRYRGRQDAVSVIAITPDTFDDAYLTALLPDRPQAFFIPEGDRESLTRLSVYFEVEGPFLSPYDHLDHGQFWLYYSPPRGS